MSTSRRAADASQIMYESKQRRPTELLLATSGVLRPLIVKDPTAGFKGTCTIGGSLPAYDCYLTVCSASPAQCAMVYIAANTFSLIKWTDYITCMGFVMPFLSFRLYSLIVLNFQRIKGSVWSTTSKVGHYFSDSMPQYVRDFIWSLESIIYFLCVPLYSRYKWSNKSDGSNVWETFITTHFSTIE